MSASRFIVIGGSLVIALTLQGCLAVAAGGAVVGVTGAVIGGAAKGVGAVGRAVIPGDSRKDDR